MARQTSKGTCAFCHKEFSKSSMTRHLESCEQRAVAQVRTGSGQKSYDFGSTTELIVKLVSEREAEAKKKAIEILARNSPPGVPCDVCGEPATSICTQCIYEDQGCLCDACAKEHKCGEEMLLPMVNSPRAGVCGYTGQDPASTW